MIDGVTLLVLFILLYMVILFPLGISMVMNVKYTEKIEAAVLETTVIPTSTNVSVSKASYTVNGQTYTWQRQAGQQVYVSPTATTVFLYYNPKNPAEASPDSDGPQRGIGTFFVVVGAICWITAIVWYIYDRRKEYQLTGKFRAWPW
jgi:hypothetical protein